MTTPQLAAILASAGFVAMIAFQIALAMGLPWGRLAWGGTHEVLPTGLRIGSLVSAAVFAFASIVVLERVRILDVLGDPTLTRNLVWFLAGFFALGVVMNAISRSPPERRVMTPVAAVLSALCWVVALSSS